MIKKIFSCIFLLCLFVSVAPVRAADDGWKVSQFTSDLTIEESGKVSVQEIISVDFNSLQKHGIFRNIPYAYEGSNSQTYTDIEVKSVMMDDIAQNYKTSYSNGYIDIKIGDPDIFISGKHTYVISYSVTGILRGFANYDELYWNVTGDRWPVPIEQITTQVTMPRDGVMQSSCFQGASKGTESCDRTIDKNRMTFSSTRIIQPNEQMTIAVGYTKGMVPLLTVDKEPNEVSLFLDQISLPTIAVSFLLLLFSGIFLLLKLWQKNGRDKSGSLSRSKIVFPEFSPPGGLRPAELGLLIDEKADTVDVTASIVDLAVRGFLTIEEIPKKWLLGSSDYKLHRTQKDYNSGGVKNYERTLLSSLFGSKEEVTMSSLKTSFYTSLSKVKEQLYEELTQKGLFTKNPALVRNSWYGIGVGLFVVGFLLTIVGFTTIISIAIGLGLALVFLGILVFLMARTMPKRTAEGYKLYRQTRGYKLFLSATEKYRQPYFEKENVFMEVLPYAIMFGVTVKLAKGFEKMGIQPQNPAWYSGVHPFTPILFAQNIDLFSNSVNTAMASTPGGSGSGGGGFSGGGFGGGGGGSW